LEGAAGFYLTKKLFTIIDLGNNSRRFNLWQFPIDWQHVFVAPHLYLEQRYKDEWDYEMVNDYELPAEVRERFVNSSAAAFIVRDRYLTALREGRKPQSVLDESRDDHFARITGNASDYDEAIELFQLLKEEMKYRIKQFGKCINATANHSDWQTQTYTSRLRRQLVTFFAEP